MSTTITEDRVARLAPGVLLRQDRARNQWMLLGPERVIVLDEPALAVVRACTGGSATVAEGITELATLYDAPRDEIATDALELLEDLRDRGFVSV